MNNNKAQSLIEIAIVAVVVSMLGFVALKPVAEKVKLQLANTQSSKNEAVTSIRHTNSDIIVETSKGTGENKTSNIEVSGTNAFVLAANQKTNVAAIQSSIGDSSASVVSADESTSQQDSSITGSGDSKVPNVGIPGLSGMLSDLIKGFMSMANEAQSMMDSLASKGSSLIDDIGSSVKKFFD